MLRLALVGTTLFLLALCANPASSMIVHEGTTPEFTLVTMSGAEMQAINDYILQLQERLDEYGRGLNEALSQLRQCEIANESLAEELSTRPEAL